MSGGHYNNHGYVYYQVEQFADELEMDIRNNNRKNEYNYCPDFSEETLQILKRELHNIRRVATLMRHIDYLYSSDYGEDTFAEQIKLMG
jgi:hypothetical protein